MNFPKFFSKGAKNAAVTSQEGAGATFDTEGTAGQPQNAWDELKNVEYHRKQAESNRETFSDLELQTISQNLRTINTPVDLLGKDQVFSGLDDKHSQRILSFMTGVGFDQYQTLDSSSVENFLERYPTPVEFAGAENQFLDAIKAANPPEKYLSYCQDMAKFKDQIYGERQSAYEQIIEGARAIMLPPQIGKTDMELQQTTDSRVESESQTDTRPQAESSIQPETATYRRLERREADLLLKNAQIDGDEYHFYDENGRPQREFLSTKFLKKCGLEPKYNINMENVNIGLSNSYMVGSHQAVTAYVQSDQGVKVCSYYRSRSAGTWRYLPDYVGTKNDGSLGIGWYGKGRSEESLTLPSEVQVALEAIGTQNRVELDANAAELAFVGTAKRYTTKAEYAALLHSGNLQGSYYQEVAANPLLKFGELAYGYKTAPETLDVNGDFAPDFSKKTGKDYKISSSIFGTATAEHFQSDNDELIYTFCQDQAGRAWLGGIESTSGEITSVGLRQNWVEAGDLATPLYEYSRVTAGYGDASDARGPYVSMWQNYLSQMPLIQKYLARQA